MEAYVHKSTGRIVTDLNTIEPSDSIENYTKYSEDEYNEYLITQRRKLDESKDRIAKEEYNLNIAEDKRVAKLAAKLAKQLEITEEEAREIIPRKQVVLEPDWTVSEKIFGGVVLPEERVQ